MKPLALVAAMWGAVLAGLLIGGSPPEASAAPAAVATLDGHHVGESFRDCPDCPVMRVLPAGAFTMGSPEGVPSPDGSTDEWPQHRVTLARPIAVGQFPVTRGQFAAFVKATGYRAGGCQHWDGNHFQPRPGLRWDTMPGQDDRHALVCVNWDDVHAYVAWLAAKTGKPYRLLSEAEWEYAAHAGTQGPRYWSGPPAMQCRHTNAADLTGQAAEPGLKDAAPCRDGWARTSPVGAFPPNAFGLYDMLGNALTWTADCYENNYLGAPTDGSSRSTGCTRPGGDWKVLRGSGWSSPPQVISALGRDVEHPISRGDAFGLRVARGE